MTRTSEDRAALQAEALSRAAHGQSMSNWPAIIHGFMAQGIPESDIRPRENVFTYHAWRALGRQVRRGEHGVKVTTFITTERRVSGQPEPPDVDTPGERTVTLRRRRPWTATVFHVSQTDPIP